MTGELGELQEEALRIARAIGQPGSSTRLVLVVTRAYLRGRMDERELLKGLVLTALAEPALSDDESEAQADAAGQRASLADSP
jgi:hypothetical protein